MKDFELRYVGSHVEVYTGSGVFLFSYCWFASLTLFLIWSK